MGYKELKVVNNNNSVNIKEKVQPRYSNFNRLDDYNFWNLATSINSKDRFNIRKNIIHINGEQWNDRFEQGWNEPARIVYSVRVKAWYGSYQWGTTGNATVKNGRFDLYIHGRNSYANNAYLVIDNRTGAYPRSKGSGIVYECDV